MSTTCSQLACATALAAALTPLANAQALAANAAQPAMNVMTLSATATQEVPMDLMSITFSTTRDGADAAAVQSQLRQALDVALGEAKRSAKAGQVDVHTGNFSLSPRYGTKGAINGWQGSVQLQVEGRDMQAISQLAGRINTLTIARVGFSLSREARERVQAETTAEAIAKFRERAKAQSALFGFGAYQIREVQVNAQDDDHPVPVMMARSYKAASADESLPVEAGKTTVSSTVSGSVQMVK